MNCKCENIYPIYNEMQCIDCSRIVKEIPISYIFDGDRLIPTHEDISVQQLEDLPSVPYNWINNFFIESEKINNADTNLYK